MSRLIVLSMIIHLSVKVSDFRNLGRSAQKCYTPQIKKIFACVDIQPPYAKLKKLLIENNFLKEKVTVLEEKKKGKEKKN